MASIRNTPSDYGWASRWLHWLSALLIFGLFGLGLWMEDLTYYHPWYQLAPFWHKALGILLLGLTLLRLGWRLVNPQPVIEGRPAEQRLAIWGHRLLYALMLAVMLAGYLISTADGRPIQLWGGLQVPALISGLPDQAKWAGRLHYLLACGLILMALGHALMALKHHFINKDNTLRKMWRS